MPQNLIEYLASFPNKLTAHHLVKIGLYPTINAVSSARKRDRNIPYSIKENNRFLYPKIDLVKFINDHYYACNRGRRIFHVSQKKIKSLQDLPVLIREKDLVDHGVFNNSRNAYKCRSSNCGPDYLRIGHKILYVRDSVIKLLQEFNQD